MTARSGESAVRATNWEHGGGLIGRERLRKSDCGPEPVAATPPHPAGM